MHKNEKNVREKRGTKKKDGLNILLQKKGFASIHSFRKH